jgi:NADPH:quinone reductase-like Zn-dependent oxidoreductase
MVAEMLYNIGLLREMAAFSNSFHLTSSGERQKGVFRNLGLRNLKVVRCVPLCGPSRTSLEIFLDSKQSSMLRILAIPSLSHLVGVYPSKSYPFDQLVAAHHDLETRRTVGSVVLKI